MFITFRMGVPQMKIVIFVDLFYILCGDTTVVTGQQIFPTVQSASSQNVCTVCLFLWPSGDDSQPISLQPAHS